MCNFSLETHMNHHSCFSITMVAMWTMGDTFKTCYFIVREAPVQFGICGALQVMVDLSILGQVYLYKGSPNSPKTQTRSD